MPPYSGQGAPPLKQKTSLAGDAFREIQTEFRYSNVERVLLGRFPRDAVRITADSATVKHVFFTCKRQTVTGATALKKAAGSGEINQFARQEFLSLYPRRDKYIQKLPGKDWQWQDRLLSDYEILGVISDEGRGLFRGCAWAHKTRMAVLDLDQGSKYRTAQELAELVAKLAAVGLAAKPYQSSDSGGWHLYLFFDEWEDSDEVKTTLKAWLKAQQYEIVGGTLEIFPSGNALRLPLQRGFAWLAPDGAIRTRREELRGDAALAAFLNDLKTNGRNWSEAKDRIESQLEAMKGDQGDSAQGKQERLDIEGFQPLFWRGIDWDKYQRGQKYWEEGLTGPKQRHDAVLCIGHYLWYGDESTGLKALPYLRNASARAELIEAWLRAKNNGHSRAVNSDRWSEVRGDIDRACSWTTQDPEDQKLEPYPLTDRLIKRLEWLYRETGKLWTVAELQKANEDKSQDARAKITAAVRQCVDQGLQITRNSLAQLTGCSPNTISKHRDLWALLRTGSHEYSGGLGGVVLAPVLLAASGPVGFCSDQVLEEKIFDSPSQPGLEDASANVLVDAGSGLPVLELAPISPMVFDSLRYKTLRSDGEQLNGNQGYDLSAATHCEFSYGVKHWRNLSRLQVGEASGTACSLNGFLPTQSAGPLQLPQTGSFLWRSAPAPGVALGNRAANFSKGASSANLTATGLGRVYRGAGGSGVAYYARAHAIGKI